MVADKILDILDATKQVNVPMVVGELPSTETEVLGIMEYTSGINTEYFGMGEDATSISTPIVKVVLRVKSYFHGVDLMDTVKEILHKYTDDDFLSILVAGSPVYFGRGETKLHEFQVTFNTQIKE